MNDTVQSIPRGGLLVAAVIASGLLTAWVMWKTQATGPQSAWNTMDGAVRQVWAQPGQPGGAAPMTAAQAQGMPVARVAGAPPIIWGSNRPHGDRGSCTQCHSILQSNGRPVPTIMSSSAMPHAFRGVCSNCHSVMGDGPVGPLPVALEDTPLGTSALTMQPPAGQASMGQPEMGGQMAQPQMAQPQMAQPPQLQAQGPVGAQPQEVEWRGLETRVGAGGGVTVNAVDGTAQRAGVMPGDVIVSLNGAPVTSMAQFEQLTMNGNLPQGTIIVLRNGQRLAFELTRAPGVGAAAPPQLQQPWPGATAGAVGN